MLEFIEKNEWKNHLKKNWDKKGEETVSVGQKLQIYSADNCQALFERAVSWKSIPLRPRKKLSMDNGEVFVKKQAKWFFPEEGRGGWSSRRQCGKKTDRTKGSFTASEENKMELSTHKDCGRG